MLLKGSVTLQLPVFLTKIKDFYFSTDKLYYFIAVNYGLPLCYEFAPGSSFHCGIQNCQKMKKRECWVRKWVDRQNKLGAWSTLVRGHSLFT